MAAFAIGRVGREENEAAGRKQNGEKPWDTSFPRPDATGMGMVSAVSLWG